MSHKEQLLNTLNMAFPGPVAQENAEALAHSGIACKDLFSLQDVPSHPFSAQ
jgi:hypothetical protein